MSAPGPPFCETERPPASVVARLYSTPAMTPIATKRSGYVAPRITLIAAPAEMPPTYTRSSSTPWPFATASAASASSFGSPASRDWCAGSHHWKQRVAMVSADCSGYATTKPSFSASASICVAPAKSSAVCVQPWSITTSGVGVAGFVGTNTRTLRPLCCSTVTVPAAAVALAVAIAKESPNAAGRRGFIGRPIARRSCCAPPSWRERAAC